LPGFFTSGLHFRRNAEGGLFCLTIPMPFAVRDTIALLSEHLAGWAFA
jgi:hypothetical protein